MTQKIRISVAGIFMLLSSGAFAGQINVPGDFPGSFTMDILSGLIVLDDPNAIISGTDPIGVGFTLNTIEKAIGFDATAFDGIGTGAGTSSITTENFSNHVIGSGIFFGWPITMSLYGSGSGSIVDNGNGTGEWSLSIGTQFEWLDGVIYDLGILDYSTSSSFDYYFGDRPGFALSQTVSGSSLDYLTGDAMFVAQTGILSGTPDGSLDGLRFTIALTGNDPVAQVVPIPASVWLFGTGLLGLVGMARRKKTEQL